MNNISKKVLKKERIYLQYKLIRVKKALSIHVGRQEGQQKDKLKIKAT